MVGWVEDWWLRLLAGLIGSGVIAWGAYRLRSLSVTGAIAAILVGTGFVTLGRPVWFGVLIAFFVSSSLWSKWKRRNRQKQQAETNYAKSGRRDAGQVFANGGLGFAICVMHALWPSEGWLYAFVGVMGAVNADTWATEIGALSRRTPRALLSGKPVPPGTSGGVTLLGSTAALAGAAFIGVAAALLVLTDRLPGLVSPVGLIAAAAIAGTAGAFIDSLLGATVQAMFRCTVCGSETERPHHCRERAKPIRGYAWMTNDAVNLLSSAAAGLLGWGVGIIAGG